MTQRLIALMSALFVLGASGEALAISYAWQFDLTPEEVTPDGSGSSASGQVWLYYETLTDHLRVVASWSDLEADLTAMHIHGRAKVGESSRTHLVDIIKDESVLLGFPDITDRRTQVWESPPLHIFAAHSGGHGHGGVPVGIPPEEALQSMIDEEAYVLVHTDDALFPGGELRGQLRLTAIPEPGAALLIGIGLCGLAVSRRDRRSELR